jgi:hypothetical protein
MRGRPFSVALLSVLVLGALVSTARAQPAPAAQAEAPLTPPVPLGDLHAGYPEGAHGDAAVVLELTLNAAGDVVDARAIEGEEPFASTAVAASSSWRFKPAERGGVAVGARIRAKTTFHEQAATPSPGGAAPAGAAPSSRPDAPAVAVAPSPPPPQPIEVTVHGELPPPSVT